jgi:hypothetical protein
MMTTIGESVFFNDGPCKGLIGEIIELPDGWDDRYSVAIEGKAGWRMKEEWLRAIPDHVVFLWHVARQEEGWLSLSALQRTCPCKGQLSFEIGYISGWYTEKGSDSDLFALNGVGRAACARWFGESAPGTPDERGAVASNVRA